MTDFTNEPLAELQGIRNRIRVGLISTLSGNLFSSNTIANAVSIANGVVSVALKYTNFAGSEFTINASTANSPGSNCTPILTVDVNIAEAPIPFSVSIMPIELISAQEETIGYQDDDED
jgi:hypothetical protein